MGSSGITTYANGNIYNGEYKNNRRNSSKSGDSTTAESSTNNHNHGNYRKKKSKKMSWEDTYAEYANETKYGALLLCVTMSNYRKWCKSRTCRKEVKAIPHGRLFAYIEGTIIDVNVHE